MEAAQFKQLVSPMNEELYVMAYHIMGNRDDALDALQDLMLRLWEQRDSLTEKQHIRGYTFTAMRHLCISRLRKQQRDSLLVPRALEEQDNLFIDAIESYTEEQMSTARDLMQRLAEPARTLMRLRFDAALSTEQIALATGLTPANVRKTLSRTLRTLKNLIQQ